VDTKFDDATQQIAITPIFTVDNAKGVNCHAVAYFYDERGVPLKDINNLYAASDGSVSSTADFTPATRSHCIITARLIQDPFAI